MTDLTICTVVFNSVHAAALMWESYLKYHDKPQLFVYDQGSTDGALEYFQSVADLLMTGINIQHGIRLDQLCKEVKTKYTLVVDTDIEFMGNIFSDISITDNTFAVSGTKNWDGILPGTQLQAQPTFQIFCTLFNTKKLQHMLNYFSFASYSDNDRNMFYDTASMIWRIANASNLEVIDAEWSKSVKHYGGITGALFANIYPEMIEQKKMTYELIKKRLMLIRNPTKFI